MTRTVLSDKDIQQRLSSIPDWKHEGDSLTRTFTHKDFVRAMGFVQSVAILAERADHHPDIDIRWNSVKLTLSTHSAGGLTELDFSLAQEIDSL